MEDDAQKLKLHSYFRSSCAHRVRIALKLKGLDYEYKAVNLLKGEQFSPEFSKLNPINFVPVLVDGDIVIADSFAILVAANIVSSSIQPLQNLAVLRFIEEKIGSGERLPWVQSHIVRGFLALEKLLASYAGIYAPGDEVYLTEFPLLSKLNEAYSDLQAFQDAVPEKQPDTPEELKG